MDYMGIDISHVLTATVVPLLGFILRYLHGIYRRLTQMLDTWPEVLKEMKELKDTFKVHEVQLADLKELNTFCRDNRQFIEDLKKRVEKLENR